MEVAKYIGLFLLKNNSCYIHGLGNIELRRKPASYDGRNLLPASYEVVVVPANTVDDSLSNFIATNEQISISKASNALKEFTESARADLSAGKEVQIPAFGSFCEVNEKLQFTTSPVLKYSYPTIPAEKNAPRRHNDEKRSMPQPAYQQEYAGANTGGYTMTPPVQQPPAYGYPQEEVVEETRKGGLNWGRIILFILILAALLGGIGFAVKNMLKPGGSTYVDSSSVQKQIEPADTLTNQALPALTDSVPVLDTENTMALPVETTTNTVAPAVDNKVQTVPMESYRVLLNSYDERPRAEKRLRTLRSYGNKVELIAEDSNTYYIVMPITAPVNRRQRVLDSLKNNFNPLGVEVY